MKHFMIFVMIMVYVASGFATAQSPDILHYKGKKFELFTNPLESFFDKNPEKRPNGGLVSSGLWRGYIATFEIIENQLYLKDIEIQYQDTSILKDRVHKWKSVLKEVFPNKNRVKIDWFNGLLVLPQGEMVNYVHMGYGSTFEKYTLLEIGKGRLKKERDFEYQEYENFKEKQFLAFKKTKKYKKIKTELLELSDSSDDELDSFLRNFIIDYTSKILTD